MKPKILPGNAIADELVMRCSVGCDDFMVFSVADIGEGGEWIEVSLAAEVRPVNFWQTIRCCWQLVWHGRSFRAGAAMSRNQVAELEAWCASVLFKTQAAPVAGERSE